MNIDSDINLIRESAEAIWREWRNPNEHERLSLADGFFAYRLLLGRNPNLNEELRDLKWLSESESLGRLLSALCAADEFSRRPRFVPGNRLLMADLSDFRFWFNTSDVEMGVRMGFGVYEPETVSFFRSLIQPGMICWDIGAQTGYMTCLFAKLVGNTGFVFAYEPSSRSVDMMRRNLRENDFEGRVEVRGSACSNRSGVISMLEASGMLVASDPASGGNEIKCVRLDEEGLPSPDVIKIDVEGHEPAVLSGMSSVLERSSPVIVMELNEYWLEHCSGTSGAAVIRQLNELGFVVSRVEAPDAEITWSEFQQDRLGNCNIVAKRGGKISP